MRWSLERMMQKLREPQPGSFLVAQHLAHMMLVQALRLHLAEGLRGGVGWLFALADKQRSAAINSMHDDPAHGWTIQKLAERAGMSRSTFALKFKQTVGASPMEYLTRWRMLLAGDRLANSSDPISVIALSLGYESESAFSTAFKRVMGWYATRRIGNRNCTRRGTSRRRTRQTSDLRTPLFEIQPAIDLVSTSSSARTVFTQTSALRAEKYLSASQPFGRADTRRELAAIHHRIEGCKPTP